MIYRVRRIDGPLSEWVWEMVADNGHAIARSTATFTTPAGAVRSARRAARAHGAGFYYIDAPDHLATIEPVTRASA